MLLLSDLDAESVRIRVDGGGDAVMQWFMILIHYHHTCQLMQFLTHHD